MLMCCHPSGATCASSASGVRRPIRVKVHGSVLHAMLWVGLRSAWRWGSQQGLEAEFEIAHGHDAVDGTLAELGGQGEDIGGDLAQVAVLLFQADQLLALCGGRALGPPAPELLRIDIDELQ